MASRAFRLGVQANAELHLGQLRWKGMNQALSSFVREDIIFCLKLFWKLILVSWSTNVSDELVDWLDIIELFHLPVWVHKTREFYNCPFWCIIDALGHPILLDPLSKISGSTPIHRRIKKVLHNKITLLPFIITGYKMSNVLKFWQQSLNKMLYSLHIYILDWKGDSCKHNFNTKGWNAHGIGHVI